MLRKDKVYIFLKQECDKLNAKDLVNVGFTAEYIAKELSLARNNISSDLNDLVKDGKVIKIKGRPTKFLDKEWAIKHGFNNLNINSMEKNDSKIIMTNCFDDLIGSNGSLLPHIKQAQAAIMYPPNGLATLLVGESGTGKTTFAEHMYRFAVSNGVLEKNAPYVVFNCADYANNPQLLMAILFGSIKGAYTGSTSDRLGIIEKANGGVLFLDEVHRLPPEGQEMLFNIIDYNKYRRLGDVEDRTVDVLIISATTENPKSVLLGTFLRRIPIIIKLPGLKERSLSERLEIITNFFNREALRVGKYLHVSKEVMVALMLYTPPGNVGELKSLVELITSRSYLDCLINHGDIKINLNHLPDRVKEALLNAGQEKIDAYNLVGFNEIIFDGQLSALKNFIKDPYDFSNEIYRLLEEKSKIYKNQKLTQGEIEIKLNRDLENAFLKYNKGILSFILRESELSKFVSYDIIDALKDIVKEIYETYKYLINQKTFISLAFHIKSLLERNGISKQLNLDEIKNNHPFEFKIASVIVEKLKQHFKRNIAENEVGFISMILYLTDENEPFKKVGVIVIAHGNSTASSMADVVNRLLKTDHVKAIDMSLEMQPSKVLEKALNLSKEINEGKGILLLVDMGSLKVIGDEISKGTGIEVVTIDNVSTPLLLEAAHKALQPYSTLKDIAKSVLEIEKNLIMSTFRNINELGHKNSVIYTVCTTGEGTALYLKKVITKALIDNDIDWVEVRATSIDSKNNAILDDKKGEEVILFAGNVSPGYYNVPFINMVDIISGNGIEKIIKYVKEGKSFVSNSRIIGRAKINNIISDALDANLNFLSGKKLMPYLKKYINIIENDTNRSLDDHKYTLIIMHLAYAIERLKFEKNGDKSNQINDSALAREINNDFGINIDENEIKNINMILEQSAS